MLTALTGDTFDVYSKDAKSLARSYLESLRKVKDPNIRRQIGAMGGFDDATIQRNQEGRFLPDVDRLTKSSGITDASVKGRKSLQKHGWCSTRTSKPLKTSFTRSLFRMCVSLMAFFFSYQTG